jgi:hypothetical protein
MRADPSDFPGHNRRTLRRPVRQRRGPAERLRAAIAELAGPDAQITAHSLRPWASITFSGARHTIALLFEGADAMPAAEAFLDALPEHDFAIPGQLVADAAIRSVDHGLLPAPRMAVTAELLLLEEG